MDRRRTERFDNIHAWKSSWTKKRDSFDGVFDTSQVFTLSVGIISISDKPLLPKESINKIRVYRQTPSGNPYITQQNSKKRFKRSYNIVIRHLGILASIKHGYQLDIRCSTPVVSKKGWSIFNFYSKENKDKGELYNYLLGLISDIEYIIDFSQIKKEKKYILLYEAQQAIKGLKRRNCSKEQDKVEIFSLSDSYFSSTNSSAETSQTLNNIIEIFKSLINDRSTTVYRQ